MTEIQWLDAFGDNLKVMMDGAGYTQRQLANETGVAESTISRYISKQQIPHVRALVNLAYALDCSLDDLMDFGDTVE